MLVITATGAAQIYCIGSYFKVYSVANTIALMVITIEMVWGWSVALGINYTHLNTNTILKKYLNTAKYKYSRNLL